MGTKIEYSINLLATSLDSNNLTVGGVDVWEHYQNKGLKDNHHRTGIKKFQDPMDRMLDRNNIESIKKTMQMHEDIFKHQVRELHRVYSVQRMLMDEHKKENRQQKFRTPMNVIDISHSHFIEQQHLTTQRSRNCSADSINMQRGFDLERPAEEDILFTRARGFDGEAGPSSYTGGTDEEMEVDLTLSIGGSQVKKSHVHQLACLDSSPNGKTRELNSSASLKSDREGECSDPTTPMSSSSVTFTQQRKGPHWLSQGLKLK